MQSNPISHGLGHLAYRVAQSDLRYLTLLRFIKDDKQMIEICMYSGVAALAFVFGFAAAINPLGAGLLGLGLYQYAKER